jgi:hypothetical protein
MQCAGDGTDGGRQITGRLLRNVFKGAWKNTLRRVGWDPTKIILAVAAFIGSWMLGGIVFSATGGFLIGLTMLAPFLFLWGIVQAQADMYGDLVNKPIAAPAPAVVAPQTNHLATPKPDFEMWRHRENLTLLEAAQLWAEVRPSVGWGTQGLVNDTYAMLSGAIQKGDLSFVPEGSMHPPAWNTAVQMEKKKPNPATKLTRAALKAFATKYGYDPEFLRDQGTGAG